jgi:putative (di)nucleoside polyphosphate hydrolase
MRFHIFNQVNKMSYANLPYRDGVGVMLLNKHKQVFVGRRIDTRSDAWQMPQGGIDNGEAPEEASLRELAEEAGITKAKIIAQSKLWLSYDLPDELIPVIWHGRYRGQRQKWFLMEFLGDDSDININAHEPEFLEWRWENPQNLPDLIVPFKRKLYEEVIAEFSLWL